jgi:hypothetical protein
MIQRHIVRDPHRRWKWSFGANSNGDAQSFWRELFNPLAQDSVLIRFGMFALVAVGLHAGADKVDDELFFVLNFFDGLMDQLCAFIIKTFGHWFSVQPKTIDQTIFKAVDLVGIQTKRVSAQYLALTAELLAVIMLAVPLLLPRMDVPSEGYRPFSHRWWNDPSFARYGVPMAVAAASLAGVLVITNATQSSSHAFLIELTEHSGLASYGAQAVAAFTLLGVAWFIFVRCFEQVLVRIDRTARNDIMQLASKRQRRLRGLWRCVIGLPISFLAVSAVPSLLATVGAILGS